MFALQKEYYELDMYRLIEEIDSLFCREVEKFFVHVEFLGTYTRAPDKIFKTPLMRSFNDERATHRNSSQLFQVCLQRKIGCCRGGIFCDG